MFPNVGTCQATIDANGNGSARFTIPGTTGSWEIARMAATGTDSGGILLVTKDGILINTTRAPASDVSTNDDLTLYPGEVIGAEWRYCTPGATMTLTLEARVSD